jgi:hypothetical protein
MKAQRSLLAILAAAFWPAAASAQTTSAESLATSIVTMWLPLVVVIGVWIYLAHRLGTGRQVKLVERNVAQMDRLEEKLNRVIELLERPAR